MFLVLFLHQDKDFCPKARCSSTTRMPMLQLVTIVTKGWHLGSRSRAAAGRLEGLFTSTTRYYTFLQRTINQRASFPRFRVFHFFFPTSLLPLSAHTFSSSRLRLPSCSVLSSSPHFLTPISLCFHFLHSPASPLSSLPPSSFISVHRPLPLLTCRLAPFPPLSHPSPRSALSR